MEIFNFISEIISYIAWPLVIIIAVLLIRPKVDIWIGAIQYKHLVLMTHIKDLCYQLTAVIRINTTAENKFDYDKIFESILQNPAAYDLKSVLKQIIAVYPKFIPPKTLKQLKPNKYKNNKKEFVDSYIDDVNSIILAVCSVEENKCRDDLRFCIQLLANIFRRNN